MNFMSNAVSTDIPDLVTEFSIAVVRSNQPGFMPESKIPMGFICKGDKCYGYCCNMKHYSYYKEISNGLVPIFIDGNTWYISPEGFQVYYNKQLNIISKKAIESLRIPAFGTEPAQYRLLELTSFNDNDDDDDMGEPPTKRRKLNTFQSN